MLSAAFDAAVPIGLGVGALVVFVMGVRAHGRMKAHTAAGDYEEAAESRSARRAAWRAATAIAMLLAVTVALQVL